MCSGAGQPLTNQGNFGLPGTLVYQPDNGQGLNMLGGNPLQYSQLPLPVEQKVVGIGFSPDGQWLAYAPVLQESTLRKGPTEGAVMTVTGQIVFETPEIDLLSASGEHIRRVLSENEIQGDTEDAIARSILGPEVSQWINNQFLHLYVFYDNYDPYSSGTILPSLFDPFQGTWPAKSELHALNRTTDQAFDFSPDMSRLVYEATAGGHYAGIALWDVSQATTIWSDPGFSTWWRAGPPMMAWTSDSATVAIANHHPGPPDEDTVLLVSREGKAKRIVDMPFLALEGSPRTTMYTIRDVAWSPDNRYLALGALSLVDNQLLLYDSAAGKYLYRCPMSADEDTAISFLLWSPDSSYIAFSLQTYAPQMLPPVLHVLNIHTGQVVLSVQDAWPVGWSGSFPVRWQQN
jgi:WD40 repeat protein